MGLWSPEEPQKQEGGRLLKKIGRGRGTEGQIESRGLGVVKMLPTKPADLSWIPRAYMLK